MLCVTNVCEKNPVCIVQSMCSERICTRACKRTPVIFSWVLCHERHALPTRHVRVAVAGPDRPAQGLQLKLSKCRHSRCCIMLSPFQAPSDLFNKFYCAWHRYVVPGMAVAAALTTGPIHWVPTCYSMAGCMAFEPQLSQGHGVGGLTMGPIRWASGTGFQPAMHNSGLTPWWPLVVHF